MEMPIACIRFKSILAATLSRRDERQQQVRIVAAAGVNRDGAAAHAIPWMRVQERLDARVVFRCDLEHETLAGLEHHAGRPDFDLPAARSRRT